MSQQLRDKLSAEIDKCLWKDLIPQAARGHVVVVDVDLDLLEVAVAIAEDDTLRVGQWMTKGQLGRSTDEHLKMWNLIPEKLFKMVVVSPYVLVQEVLSS